MPDLQNTALGLLKWSLGPPNLLQVNQKSTRIVVWRLLATPREPSRALGSGLGAPQAAKMGAKKPQGSPKASQNGANIVHRIRMRFKTDPTWDQIPSAQKN